MTVLGPAKQPKDALRYRLFEDDRASATLTQPVSEPFVGFADEKLAFEHALNWGGCSIVLDTHTGMWSVLGAAWAPTVEAANAEFTREREAEERRQAELPAPNADPTADPTDIKQIVEDACRTVVDDRLEQIGQGIHLLLASEPETSPTLISVQETVSNICSRLSGLEGVAPPGLIMQSQDGIINRLVGMADTVARGHQAAESQLGSIASRLSGLEEAVAAIERRVVNDAPAPETDAADEATLDRDRSEDAAAPPHFAPAAPPERKIGAEFLRKRADEAWAKAERGERIGDREHKAIAAHHIMKKHGGVRFCAGRGFECGYPILPSRTHCLTCEQAENRPQPSPDASDGPIPTRGREEAEVNLAAAESALREAERNWAENPVGETERAMARAQDAVSEARNAVEAYGPRRAKCVWCGQMFSADLGVRGWCPTCRCEPDHAPPAEAKFDRTGQDAEDWFDGKPTEADGYTPEQIEAATEARAKRIAEAGR